MFLPQCGTTHLGFLLGTANMILITVFCQQNSPRPLAVVQVVFDALIRIVPLLLSLSQNQMLFLKAKFKIIR